MAFPDSSSVLDKFQSVINSQRTEVRGGCSLPRMEKHVSLQRAVGNTN